MAGNTLLTLCTLPDTKSAGEMAEYLVKEGLAACVSLTPPVRSVYAWEGAIESAEEVLLLIKTSRERYTAVEQAIAERHPYELPEIIAVPVELGLEGYLKWVETCTKKEP